MRISLVAVLLGAVSFFSRAAVAVEPPKLITTSPDFWATNINAASQRVVSLTFDQTMRPGNSAWLGRSSLSPEVNLDTLVSDDRKTFKLNVRLQPGKVYVFGLNEKGLPGVGFQNDYGISLPPHFLVFQTIGNPSAEDAPPKVVRTTPGNGSNQVDPLLTKSLVIQFDKPMRTAKHGLQLFENNNRIDVAKFPGQYSPDGRTFTFPYNFKPLTQYVLEFNGVQNIGFVSSNRVPLWPVRMRFATGPLRQ